MYRYHISAGHHIRAAMRILLVAVIASAGALSPVADTPYCETVPKRFTSAGLPKLANWPGVPAKDPTQVLALPGARFVLVGGDGTLLVGSRAGADGNATFQPLSYAPEPTPGARFVVVPPAATAAADNASATVQFSLGAAFPATGARDAQMAVLRCTTSDTGGDCAIQASATTVAKLAAAAAQAPVAQAAQGATDMLALRAPGGAVSLWAAYGDGGLWTWHTGQVRATRRLAPASVHAVAAATATVATATDTTDTDTETKAGTNSGSAAALVQVAAGGPQKLWLIDTDGSESGVDSFVVRRWEWVTQLSTESGGAIADSITALAFGPDVSWGWAAGADGCGSGSGLNLGGCIAGNGGSGDGGTAAALYIGSRDALNIRHADGTIERIDGESGLPYGNISALAVMPAASASTPDSSSPRGAELWIGTSMGMAVLDLAAKGGAAAVGDAAAGTAAHARWRYLYGPRWHPGTAVVSLATLGAAAADHAPAVAAVTDGGLSLLELQCDWTLRRKAALYESMFRDGRHDRHGLVSDCRLPAWGDTRGACATSDSDNDGLWTAVLVAAEAFRYATESRDASSSSSSAAAVASARAAVERRLGGMELLYRVTGVAGLMARSTVSPGEAHSGTHDVETWRNSTTAGYEQWLWKGDTSSDEVVGHMFAYPIIAEHVPDDGNGTSASATRSAARRLQLSTAGYIASNGFNLVDTNGNVTTWGRWSPADVNGNRDFSDERGLQALQVLAYLAAANTTLSADPRAGDAVPVGRVPRTMALNASYFAAAYAHLCNDANQYGTSIANVKILTPGDDNFSDDELMMLPFYTHLHSGSGGDAAARAAVLLGLRRAFAGALRAERSDLWNAIALAVGAFDGDAAAELQAGMLWNLRTWPLELIDWPFANAHRLDVRFRYQRTRFQKRQLERVLPANERWQGRWNANPYDAIDGGKDPNPQPNPDGPGRSQTDPGAWLLPYWMARYHGLLANAASATL